MKTVYQFESIEFWDLQTNFHKFSATTTLISAFVTVVSRYQKYLISTHRYWFKLIYYFIH